MGFGLAGPLQPPFEQKLELRTPNVTPDAATLTLYALNFLKMPNTSKYLFDLFQNVQHFKLSNVRKSGGFIYSYLFLCFS